MTPVDLYQQIKLSAEAFIKGTPTPEDEQFLHSNPDIYEEVLKEMKVSVENQLSSHKSQMTSLHHDYVARKISLESYTERRKDAFTWRIRALSFLQAIESQLSLIKIKRIFHAK